MAMSTNESAFSEHTAEFTGKRLDLKKDIKDLGNITGVLASDAMNVVQKNASEYYDKGVKQVMNLEKNLEERIQRHPMQSLLIVAGIGLFLGAVWNRR